MARPRQVSDDEILEAARACFLEHGPAVSTTVIADKLGVSQAALFKRFGTKQDLMLAALVPSEVPAWITLAEGGPDTRPIPEQLLEMASAISAFFEEMAPRLAILKASGQDVQKLMRAADGPPAVRGREALAAWLTQAQKQGRLRASDASATALMFIGSLHGRAFMCHVLGLSGLHDLDGYVAELVDTLWHGIAPKETP